MKEYRFKKVQTDGHHNFYTLKFETRIFAFDRASHLASALRGIDHIDVYEDSKLIATFYK